MSIRLALITIIALAATNGCSRKPEERTAMPKSIGPVISTAAISRLEEADKADGVTDHVIGKCYVCGLGMDGSEKFAVKVQGYTAHLCSQACQKEFADSADKIILGTEIPIGNRQE
jgi:hypothetical protein